MRQMIKKDVVIAINASLSDEVTLDAERIVGFMMPADWTAADLTLQGSVDGVTFHNVYDDNDAELTVQAAEDRFVVMRNTDQLAGLRRLKVRSGTSGSPVNQAAARTISLVCDKL